ncbi:MAG TPA: hypothetical protein VJB37_00890 [Patescibacteria group bacterium]|nr:hypothetical protein [Patescibacteria group bacterium]
MNWVWLSLGGYLLLALVYILDKLIVSKAAVKPAVYTFYSTIFLWGAIFILPFTGFQLLNGQDWLWAVVSGVSFGCGLGASYLAMKKGEISHIGPFIGALVMVDLFFLGKYFLGEQLTVGQMGGGALLALACLLLSFEKSRNHHGFHIGFLWAFLAAFLFAVSHVSAKFLYTQYPFWTGFAWTRTMTGLVGLALLLVPTVRRSWKRSTKEAKGYAHRHAKAIVLGDKILGVAAVVILQLAMSQGPVALVGALAGGQYLFIFFLVFLFSKFFPHWFKEYFTKQEIILELVALLLVVLGSALVVF